MKNTAMGAIAILALAGHGFAADQNVDWNADPVSQVSVGQLLTAANTVPAALPKLSAIPKIPSLEDKTSDLKLGDPHLDQMFHASISETSRQASYESDGTVYVKTGDIPAEWLRDSSAQLRPYLFFAKDDKVVDNFLKAAIVRQFRYLAIDPYANAFKEDYSVFEEKYELDSLLYPITLGWTYWKTTGDAGVFSPDVVRGLKDALQTMKDEQDHASSHYAGHKELGKNPVGPTGMIWTGFRPSDDACVYNYLIPSEMMAVTALGELAEIENFLGDAGTAQKATLLRDQVQAGIKAYGIVDAKGFGNIYAYEVDGLGHQLLVDDANIPSLLSAPYIGYVSADDPVYKSTRRFLFSPKDPYFYSDSFEDDNGQEHAMKGIGSPHTPKGYVWPLAILSQAMTSYGAERQKAVSMLAASDPGDGLLHESFNPGDPTQNTRADFSWPNAMFAEFLLQTQGGFAPLPSPPRP